MPSGGGNFGGSSFKSTGSGGFHSSPSSTRHPQHHQHHHHSYYHNYSYPFYSYYSPYRYRTGWSLSSVLCTLFIFCIIIPFIVLLIVFFSLFGAVSNFQSIVFSSPQSSLLSSSSNSVLNSAVSISTSNFKIQYDYPLNVYFLNSKPQMDMGRKWNVSYKEISIKKVDFQYWGLRLNELSEIEWEIWYECDITGTGGLSAYLITEDQISHIKPYSYFDFYKREDVPQKTIKNYKWKIDSSNDYYILLVFQSEYLKNHFTSGYVKINFLKSIYSVPVDPVLKCVIKSDSDECHASAGVSNYILLQNDDQIFYKDVNFEIYYSVSKSNSINYLNILLICFIVCSLCCILAIIPVVIVIVIVAIFLIITKKKQSQNSTTNDQTNLIPNSNDSNNVSNNVSNDDGLLLNSNGGVGKNNQDENNYDQNVPNNNVYDPNNLNNFNNQNNFIYSNQNSNQNQNQNDLYQNQNNPY